MTPTTPDTNSKHQMPHQQWTYNTSARDCLALYFCAPTGRMHAAILVPTCLVTMSLTLPLPSTWSLTLPLLPHAEPRRYLSDQHDATTIGVLLGMSAACRGTADSTVARMLFLHLPARHPNTFPEIELSPHVQVGA